MTHIFFKIKIKIRIQIQSRLHYLYIKRMTILCYNFVMIYDLLRFCIYRSEFVTKLIFCDQGKSQKDN